MRLEKQTMSRSRDISKRNQVEQNLFLRNRGQTTFATDDTSTALSYTVVK